MCRSTASASPRWEPDRFCGEMAVLDGDRRCATVTARTPMTLYSVDARTRCAASRPRSQRSRWVPSVLSARLRIANRREPVACVVEDRPDPIHNTLHVGLIDPTAKSEETIRALIDVPVTFTSEPGYPTSRRYDRHGQIHGQTGYIRERKTGTVEAPDQQHEWALRGSNPRPPACKAGALPAELSARNSRDLGEGPRRWRPPAEPSDRATSTGAVPRRAVASMATNFGERSCRQSVRTTQLSTNRSEHG